MRNYEDRPPARVAQVRKYRDCSWAGVAHVRNYEDRLPARVAQVRSHGTARRAAVAPGRAHRPDASRTTAHVRDRRRWDGCFPAQVDDRSPMAGPIPAHLRMVPRARDVRDASVAAVSESGIVVVRHDPCPWLPAGGRAEVVRSAAEPPAPTAVVRLLVTSGDQLWVVPRPDGRGLDLPTAVVTGGVPEALAALRRGVPGGTTAPRPLGFVRNTVPDAPADYAWPAPVAHFAVWQCTAERQAGATGSAPDPEGRWLDPDEAAAALGDRHWWPLRVV